jgi:two-component system, NtrC family, response regulator AtoC
MTSTPPPSEGLRILVIDDDAGLRRSTSLLLADEGHEVQTAANGREGLERAEAFRPDLILADVRMPVMDGMAFLEAWREAGGAAPVIMTTAYGSMELAIRAMKAGAYDYLPKPFGRDELVLALRKASEREQLRREVTRLRAELPAQHRFGDVVARSVAMRNVLEMLGKVAPHPTSVLLTGPTGTGKELLARVLHRESPRRDGPFVAVNCGAIPENLLESEFFGYVRGAFTGADRDREGLLEAAAGGTLFLDEVGDLPEPLQVKLLRAIQEREVRRLGETRARALDLRILAATNRDLERDIDEGRFRSDLYFRLAVVTLAIPALSERPDDIPPLVDHVMARLAERLGRTVRGVEAPAMEALTAYSWPGNVRELENVLERAIILAEGDRIRRADLPAGVRSGEAIPGSPSAGASDADLSVKRRTALLERDLITRALERTGGHRGRAAGLLELSDRALRYKIREYGIGIEK